MRRTVAITFLSMVFGIMGLLCIAWAFRSLTRSEYLSALVVSAFAVFTFGMIAMMTVVTTRRVTARVEYDDAGTTFRPDRKVDGLLMVATIAAFVAMTLYSICTPLGLLNIPVPPGNRQYLVFACVAGALVGLVSLRQIVRQRGMSHLRLTVEGVQTGNALSSTGRPWEDVSAVTDRPPNGRHAKKSGTTYITTADGGTRTLPSDWYTPGGDALRKLVRIYWQHPEFRDELTDGRAVERLRTGFWP